MSYFVVGLTNVDPSVTVPVYKQYRHVQYNDFFSAGATASVNFPTSQDTFRYVVIQRQFTDNNAICIGEVKVFLRGMFYMYRKLLFKTMPNNDNCQLFVL